MVLLVREHDTIAVDMLVNTLVSAYYGEFDASCLTSH
jgi:hypothetical protein